jgi:aminopeptidase N
MDIDGPLTEVPALAGEPVADLVLLNDEDLTFAKVRLDEESTARLPRVLPALADPLARAVVWGAVLDATRDAECPAVSLVALAKASLAGETEATVLENVLEAIVDLAGRHLSPPLMSSATSWTCPRWPPGAIPGWRRAPRHGRHSARRLAIRIAGGTHNWANRRSARRPAHEEYRHARYVVRAPG